MKILFAANRLPYPPYRGDKLKIYNLARRLAGRHELHLLTFLQDKDDEQYLPELKKVFEQIHLVPLGKAQSYFNSAKAFLRKEPFQVRYFASEKMRQKVAEVTSTHNYDAVHVQHLRLAQYWHQYRNIPRILDLPDAYSLYWRRRAEQLRGLKVTFAKWEYERVDNYEVILNQFDKVLACSQEDVAWLEHKGIQRLGLLPNGVDTEVFNLPPHDYSITDRLLFTGNMDYAPNVDAVRYFVKDVFPIIQKSVPTARFTIAGQRPVKPVLALQSDAVQVTGFVPDLADVYSAATVVVAPLRFGAGTQNKVLEAMAMGVPVVSGAIGFNGLNVVSGEGVLKKTNTEEFAQACIDLLQRKELRHKTGTAGQEVIRKYFSWDMIAQKLEDYLEEIAGASPKG
ncbi:MAG: glycosyltransferase [Edaphocola sp.]